MQHKLTKIKGHQEIRNNISKKQTEADCKDHRQTDRPSVSGAVVEWNLSIDLLLFTEQIRMNSTAAIMLSKMQILTQMVQ